LRNGEHHLDAPALDAGRYTLEVLGVNADGVRSERPARLSVEVASPYWKTAAFYLVLLLLAGAGGAAALVVGKKLKAARLPAEIDFVPFMEKYGLSQREREIFVLLMRGRKNKDIAGELFISENTVKVHVYNIYRKLGVNSRLGILEMLRRR
jgi:DNA-binding CsgD family transcriptional regulator